MSSTETPVFTVAGVEVPWTGGPKKTAREDLLGLLEDWAKRHDLEPEDVVLDTDLDDDLVIILPGLTVDGGDIVAKRRTYEVQVDVTLRVTVTVEARDADEAEAIAVDDAYGYDYRCDEADDVDVMDTSHWSTTLA